MSDIPPSVTNFLLSMQAGRPAAGTLPNLFTADAVYVESFSGQRRSHEGKAAVIAAIEAGWHYPLPDMHLRVDHVAVEGEMVTLDWTCLSPGLPGGQGQGINRYRMRAGLIAHLETLLKETRA